MTKPRLTRIEWGILHGKRPRSAGCNARLPVHGSEIHEPYARIHFDDGSSGFGYGRVTREQAQALLGRELDSLISLENGASEQVRQLDFPLWDALGQRTGKPVYRLLVESRQIALDAPFTAACYDTTLYFDDLHLDDHAAGAALMADEARQGYERGHRAFKIKVGRGALHMPLAEGIQRDIAVIRAVREAIGPGLPLMIDANNGYNFNITRQVLAETADCEVFWMEEPFHEDPVLYQNLHEWLDKEGIATLIADGEGQASPSLLDWARDGAIDVVQYDIRGYGFSNWLQLGPQLDEWGVKSAPHNYACAYGNYSSCHVVAVINNFTFTEWDHIDLDGLDTSGYALNEGRVRLPDAPGFGLSLDEATFQKSVQSDGFMVTA